MSLARSPSSQKKTNSFDLTDKQKEIRSLLSGPQMHTLIYGGSRSGKTFLLNYAIGVRAIRAPNSRHVIARLHNIDVRQSVMGDTFPKMMRLAFPSVRYKANKVDQFVTLSNGSEIWFAGLDDKDRVEKILGKEFATIYVNETSQVSYSSVETLRTRLAQGIETSDGRPLPLRAYYDLNPTGRSHWTYREFHMGIKPTGEAVRNTDDFCYAVMNPGDNPHLPGAYLEALEGLSSRQRKRFLEGEYLADVPGALWNSGMIDASRVPWVDPATLTRIVVAIDPAISANDESNETGIIVAGVAGTGQNAKGYILQDASGRYSPGEWAKKARDLYDEWGADRIVAEGNQGGAMVEATIRSAGKNLPVKIVHASRGKQARAEPVAALYEKSRIHHVGALRDKDGHTGLEDQLTSWVPGESDSPDRLDALVWAITELMLTGTVTTKVRVIR